MVKARAMAKLRADSCLLARSVLAREHRKPPRWEKASVQVLAYRSPSRRRHDRDNLAAALKAAWDGLQDAGIVGNDRGLVPLAIDPSEAAQQVGVRIAIREISTAPTSSDPSPGVG